MALANIVHYLKHRESMSVDDIRNPLKQSGRLRRALKHQSDPAAICLTIGDPTGIGPEITAKFLQTFHPACDTLSSLPSRLIVLGDLSALERAAEQRHLPLPESFALQYEQWFGSTPGATSYAALEAAVSKIHRGDAALLVTGPISKENLRRLGYRFPDIRKYFSTWPAGCISDPASPICCLCISGSACSLLTRHVALRKVSEALSIPRVQQSIENLLSFLTQRHRIETPSLCVLGVNPHAGEAGGDEEARILQPALNLISKKYGFAIEPPKAADAVFRNFNLNHLRYDAYVAAYHDQGLIPFKMVAGLDAVNVTIGLPFLRTSVSHGTAPDIVGQGIASPASLHAAYELACALVEPTLSNEAL